MMRVEMRAKAKKADAMLLVQESGQMMRVEIKTSSLNRRFCTVLVQTADPVEERGIVVHGVHRRFP